MIPDKWQFQVTDSTKAQYNLLKSLINRDDISEIICATDADREGECIFRYVYNMANCKKTVKRLWVSSLEESAIRKALTAMKLYLHMIICFQQAMPVQGLTGLWE